jgi:crotonobetainyl-CoA:carnitine CoA-transferase CaiB-like acyl-CoA transferase
MELTRHAARDPAWRDLFDNADIIIDTAPVGSADRIWIDENRAGNENAIQVAITPHGLTGARAQWPGNELTADALSGWASVNGLADRSPLKSSGYQPAYQAGTLAFGAVLCALIHRQVGGAGQTIDVAMDEVLATTFAPGVLRSLYEDKPWPRRDTVDFTTGPVPVKDGHFALTLTRPHFWAGAMRLLGLDDLADDPRIQTNHARADKKNKKLFVERVEAAMTGWTKDGLFAGLSKIPVVAGPAYTMDELARNPQFEARGFFVEHDGIKFPGPPFKMSRTPLRGIPKKNQETPQIRPPKPAAPRKNPAAGPLSGYSGVVLTQAWAGSLATQLMGLMGAEIILVESRTRLDSWRGVPSTPIAPALRNRDSIKHPWNCNALFNSVNLNKQSVTLELSEPEGVETFKRLVAEADFVAENFSPRVMGKLGIAYDDLRAVKEDIILCSISGFGQTGPWSPLPAIGGTIEPASGMSALLGYEGSTPMNSGQMYPDAVAGLYGFAALALALYHRERSGEGQFIDMSMQEANFTFIGERWLEYALTGKVPGPMGNRHAAYAPHGIYPCAGKDRWIAIAAQTDDQWEALCRVAKRPQWHDRFCGDRKANEDALDAAIETWTGTRDRDELAVELAEADVIAAPVLNGLEVAHDPVFRARGAIQTVDHPEAGAWPQPAIPCHFSQTPAKVTGAAPIKGAHCAEVFARLLGMDAREFEHLVDIGVTGLDDPLN